MEQPVLRVNRPSAQRLAGMLVLCSVQDGRDAERFAAFNAAVNGDDQGATCAAPLQHHSGAAWDGFPMVEDEATGEVVSTTCLIPWRCRLAGVTLDVAMLEMVVTHPDSCLGLFAAGGAGTGVGPGAGHAGGGSRPARLLSGAPVLQTHQSVRS